MIREAIVSGRLKPGQRIRERDLVAQLNISRSPLREAIRTLESEGFLTAIPHRGAWVSELSASDLFQMVQVRIMLETYAARLFIERNDPKAIAQIESQVAQALIAGPELDSETNFDLALEFHDLLVAASGNDILVQLHRTFKRHQRRYQHFAFARMGHDRQAMEEHAAILDALRRRDTAAVERHLTAHLVRFYEEIAPLFDAIRERDQARGPNEKVRE